PCIRRCTGRRSKRAVAAYGLLHVGPDLRIIPGLRGLVHIILAEQLPERHDEGGGIVCLRAPEKLNNIVVIVGERKIMLEVGMAIENHGDVIVEMALPFDDDIDAGFACGLDEHLALAARRLRSEEHTSELQSL